MPALRLLAAIAAVIAAGPALAAERTFSITGFDRVRIDGPFSVKLKTNVAPFARASGSVHALDAVTVEVQGRTLIVRPNRAAWGGYPGKSAGPVEISLGTHDLSAARVNGSGTLAIDRIRGLSFNLAVQGSGGIRVAAAEVDQLDVGIAGNGNAAIAGTALKLTAAIRGIASFDGSALRVKDATIATDGATTISATISNSVKVTAQGTAAVTIAGDPACTVKTTGSAVVSGCD